MSQNSNLSVLKGLRWIAASAFHAAGYQWVAPVRGKRQLGYWRIRLSEKKRSPKRFVLVPGFGDSSLSWLLVLAMLHSTLRAEFDEVVLLDFPGFQGFLGDEKCVASMSLLMKSVKTALDGLKPHTILGHSLGGWLTGYYASSFGRMGTGYRGPEVVILANPAGVFPSEEEKDRFKERFNDSMRKGINPIVPALFAEPPVWFKLLEHEFSQFLFREDIHRFVKSIRHDHAIEKRLKDVQARVWLVWGKKDTLIPSDWVTHWLEGLPEATRAQAFVIQHAGHGIQVEKPAATAALLAQILEGKEEIQAHQGWWKAVEE